MQKKTKPDTMADKMNAQTLLLTIQMFEIIQMHTRKMSIMQSMSTLKDGGVFTQMKQMEGISESMRKETIVEEWIAEDWMEM